MPSIAFNAPVSYNEFMANSDKSEKDNKSDAPSNGVPDATERLGTADERQEVVIKRGETFWQLAELKYGGMHPIDAIYEANGLSMRVELRDGETVVSDPIYFADHTYVFPSKAELYELKEKFWSRCGDTYDLRQPNDGATDSKSRDKARVGPANERTEVRLRWDDTLYQLACNKYGSSFSIEAIFEANNMTPKVVKKDGKREYEAPIYYAGQVVVLPADNEAPALRQKFCQRMGVSN